MKPFSEMNAVERLAFAQGKPMPTIELDRSVAQEVAKALKHAGQHALASKVQEAIQWAL